MKPQKRKTGMKRRGQLKISDLFSVERMHHGGHLCFHFLPLFLSGCSTNRRQQVSRNCGELWIWSHPTPPPCAPEAKQSISANAEPF